MDFFCAKCQTGPHTAARFGICDDQDTSKAYVDLTAESKWTATVENPEGHAVTFTAIDKCVILDNEHPDRGRCDAMLSTHNRLYLVELKDKGAPWRQHAIDQLTSTIEFLIANHDISRFKHKKAFACNKRQPKFVEIDNEQQLSFRKKYGFRIDVQATVLIV